MPTLNPVHVVEDNLRRPEGWPGRLVGRLMVLQHRSLTEWTIAQMEVAPTDRVLDVGCGGGTALGLLAARATDGFVAGVDYADEMVRQARRRHAREVAAGRVEVERGDAMALPHPDGAFDQVCAIETFYFWPDPLRGVREAHRVLRPGGRLTIALEMSAHGADQRSRYRRAMTARYVRRAEELGQRIVSGTDLVAMMTEVGFAEGGFAAEPDRSLGWVRATARRAG